MKQSLKIFLLLWIAFGGVMGILFMWQAGPRFGVPIGLVSGLLFASIMTAFAHYQARKFRGLCPLEQGERLLKEGPANHIVGAEGVGGWLYFTTSRLYFRSHKINIQNHELVIALEQIVSVKTSGMFSIILNGLTVETRNGTEKFVVQGVRDWAEMIVKTKPAGQ